MRTVQYFLSPRSPWTYLGHGRLMQIADRHGVDVQPLPFDLSEKVFPISGGLPLPKRPPQRQAYRLIELRRWSSWLDIPLVLQPRYFPVDDLAASLMVALCAERFGHQAANRLAGAFMAAVWAQERNIADPDTLQAIAAEQGLDGAMLYEERSAGQAAYDLNTARAIELQVFGAPWYVYNGEPFWGQDRLDFLDRALAAG